MLYGEGNMKQKDFLIWMLGFPIVYSFGEFVTEYLIKRTYSVETHGFATGFTIIFYIIVGYCLWNEKNR